MRIKERIIAAGKKIRLNYRWTKKFLTESLHLNFHILFISNLQCIFLIRILKILSFPDKHFFTNIQYFSFNIH